MSHARSEYKDFMTLAPDAYAAVQALGEVAAKAGIDKQLLELIKLRASQINGCAFCVQYHPARRASVSPQTSSIWSWSGAERRNSRHANAALAWLRALAAARRRRRRRGLCAGRCGILQRELVYLTSAIASINVWNRFGVAYPLDPAGTQRRWVRQLR